MYLRQLEVVGFRGINRLSIRFKPDMVLIGENMWGKSSLLSALSLVFNPEQDLYQFTTHDFHIPIGQSQPVQHLTLLFTFCESEKNEDNAEYNQPYTQHQLFVNHPDGYQRLYLRVEGEIDSQNNIRTDYSFLDEDGNAVIVEDIHQLVFSLISRHPVYRFRDARLNRSHHRFNLAKSGQQDNIQDEIQAVVTLLCYYFLNNKDITNVAQDTTLLWHKVKSLCLKLRRDETQRLRKKLFISLASLFIENKHVHFGRFTRPIVLFEDPDARLHPRMVAIMWELVSYLPVQRITTTNSVELISQVNLSSICRLVRTPEKIKSFQLKRRDLGKEDFRRLSFHIHHNRSLALFSGLWILVEGETEVWILSELAKLLEINLDMEGIRIVEFAQSGLKPLIKYADAMGIQWYVLTDGDEAGRKYRDIVLSMLENEMVANDKITVLPKRDIEHFFYANGFADVFIRLAHWVPKSNYYPTTKIIQRAIQRVSKPDLAIALSNEIANRGSQSIPLLFKRLFSKVLSLART
ncbi:ATP-dependent endonuclease [Pasteurella multocida subsp. multocida OH4807]|nr:ATP-dependent endonuclease [Pasteurella multocida subsp. multocida OH4807]